jgi:UDP-N-acetylmuramate-alanine ligase
MKYFFVGIGGIGMSALAQYITHEKSHLMRDILPA